MINYEYLQYWHQTNEDIIFLGHLIRENIDMYQRTQDIECLEYIIENVKEIIRLIPKREEYFKKINYFKNILRNNVFISFGGVLSHS